MKSYPQRKSPRLPGYDYSQSGAYFATICTAQRQHLFGEIHDSIMRLNLAGEVAAGCWLSIPDHYLSVHVDMFVVMPNHTHCIVFIQDDNKDFKTILGHVVNAYKGAVTARIRAQLGVDNLIVWQSRYHDHIIRDEAGLNHIRSYIENNPARWSEDVFFANE
jgi:REP element-mobilizing transposase RayT